ncbi:MAG: heavy metal translocating P-type ATPase [bacterium]|nr:heavy metal translocating P-type ATPase [bacterium]
MDHSHHNKHSHEGAMSHGSAISFLRRFWIVTFLLIPLALTNEAVSGFLGIGEIELGKWIQFVIATIIFGFALVFFQHAWHEIKARKYGMMTLVSLAVASGYLFSVASTFVESIDVEFYLEISTLIWVLLFGHYLEARSSSAAGNALQEVAKLLPKKAHKLVGGKEEDVDIESLREGDQVLVKPGEKIPADGSIIGGGANVNESLISGESKPVRKESGDQVVAGAICLDGSLTIRLDRVGENSTIGQIQKLIAEAQSTKPKTQRIADKASGILTLVAGVTALLTLVVWTLVIGQPFVFAMTLAITVLVIACPHALGLAIPTVTTITTSLAVKNGIFIKNLAKLEVIRKTDYVVFDKTGTLTKGEFGVTDVLAITKMENTLTGEDENDCVLRLAASLDAHSSHIIGISIVEHAKEKDISMEKITQFANIAGKGVSGTINKKKYLLGNMALMQELGDVTSEAQKVYDRLSGEGKTVVLLGDEKQIVGAIALADQIKEESKEAVDGLHSIGVKVAMLTGDNKQVAEGVSKSLGIDTYFAEVLPEDKYKHIKELQEKGHIVLMVGDGVNDAPALTQANAGIAIGAGTDVAVEAGDIVLMRNSPGDIVRLIILAKKVYRKMVQNLVWALGYNIVAIPAAAGVFALWGFFLRPEIGALVMSLSTVIVVINAMTLKRTNLSPKNV